MSHNWPPPLASRAIRRHCKHQLVKHGYCAECGVKVTKHVQCEDCGKCRLTTDEQWCNDCGYWGCERGPDCADEVQS